MERYKNWWQSCGSYQFPDSFVKLECCDTMWRFGEDWKGHGTLNFFFLLNFQIIRYSSSNFSSLCTLLPCDFFFHLVTGEAFAVWSIKVRRKAFHDLFTRAGSTKLFPSDCARVKVEQPLDESANSGPLVWPFLSFYYWTRKSSASIRAHLQEVFHVHVLLQGGRWNHFLSRRLYLPFF